MSNVQKFATSFGRIVGASIAGTIVISVVAMMAVDIMDNGWSFSSVAIVSAPLVLYAILQLKRRNIFHVFAIIIARIVAHPYFWLAYLVWVIVLSLAFIVVDTATGVQLLRLNSPISIIFFTASTSMSVALWYTFHHLLEKSPYELLQSSHFRVTAVVVLITLCIAVIVGTPLMIIFIAVVADFLQGGNAFAGSEIDPTSAGFLLLSFYQVGVIHGIIALIVSMTHSSRFSIKITLRRPGEKD